MYHYYGGVFAALRLLSATETAFSSASTTRLKTLAEKGNANAALACRLLEQYDRLLSTILIGNNIVNIATASIGTVLFVRHYGDAGATISTVVVTVVVLIFGEISPKSIAKDCAERFAMFSAPILRVLIWVLLPLNLLFSLWKKLLAKAFRLNGESKMSQEELLMLVDEVQQGGSIDKSEGELLRNAIEFSEQQAKDILIHRVDLAALPVAASWEETAALFTNTKYSRLLVYQDSIDHILGTIHRKDFYVGCGVTGKPIAELLSPTIFAPENEPISLLLKRCSRARRTLPSWWTNMAAPAALSRWRISSKSWWARYGTSTSRRRFPSARRRSTLTLWTQEWTLTILPISSTSRPTRRWCRSADG